MTARPLPLLSQDDDPTRRRRRLRTVLRDIQLHLSSSSCDRCRQASRLDGGNGCHCATGITLATRCQAVAAGACYCTPERAA